MCIVFRTITLQQRPCVLIFDLHSRWDFLNRMLVHRQTCKYRPKHEIQRRLHINFWPCRNSRPRGKCSKTESAAGKNTATVVQLQAMARQWLLLTIQCRPRCTIRRCVYLRCYKFKTSLSWSVMAI
jgi:hypothetical protein